MLMISFALMACTTSPTPPPTVDTGVEVAAVDLVDTGTEPATARARR